MIELPVCRWRSPLKVPWAVACASQKLRMGTVPTAFCQSCQEADHAPVAETPPLGLCAHLGERIGWRDCVQCGTKTKLKVFACLQGHGDVTVLDCATRNGGKPCPDHDPVTTP